MCRPAIENVTDPSFAPSVWQNGGRVSLIGCVDRRVSCLLYAPRAGISVEGGWSRCRGHLPPLVGTGLHRSARADLSLAGVARGTAEGSTRRRPGAFPNQAAPVYRPLVR
jgi:hypothetical protein